MKRQAPMARKTPVSRQAAAIRRSPWKRRSPKKRAGHDPVMRNACEGEPCYLRMPQFGAHPRETVVPCHGNSLSMGKGMGLKVPDRLTVPGCMYCHHELDQGHSLTREQKLEIFLAALARWEPVRAAKLGIAPPSTTNQSPEGAPA